MSEMENEVYEHWDGRKLIINRVVPETKYNLYICVDGHYNLSVDMDKGTTPMFVICRQPSFHREDICGLTASSEMYVVGDVANFLPVNIIFRKPTKKEVSAATPAQREHYELGGLHMEWIGI